MALPTIIELLGNGGDPIQMTVATSSAVPMNTLCKLTTPRTVSASSADNDMFGGIAANEHEANTNSATTMTVYTHLIAGLTPVTGSTIVAGNEVSINGANEIKVYTTLDKEKGYGFGTALSSNDTSSTTQIPVLINWGG